jgi:glycosyltransferase involved in cell wall biosynthesis
MRIAQVAPLAESVPPRGYGGTERVVAWLTDALVGRGHEVTLFASGDSRTAAKLVAAWPRAVRTDPTRPDPGALAAIQLAQVFERADEFDVIHSHVDCAAFPFGRLRQRPPLVHTLHGRLDPRHLAPFFQYFRDAPLVSVSDDQRRPLARLGLNWVATIHHGLPLDRFPAGRDGQGGYLAFIGRMSPAKRPDLAIEVAKRAGLPLRMAAKVDPVERDYFAREIEPLLDHPLVEFIGEIDDARKAAFLGDARCLLFPIDWPEPFGLVVVEALACGTPVVARPCGAVPELVRDGETGYLADTLEELVRAVKRIDLIDRARCRRHVEARFSVAAMADRYEAVYRGLVGERRRGRRAS